MDCTHRWIVESPWDARRRWESTGEEPTYRGVCKFCKAEKDFDVSKEDEDYESLPEMQDRDCFA